MGRKAKKRLDMPEEGKKQSMKKLTKGHDKFQKSRNKGQQELNPNGKEDFEKLLEKSIKSPKK